MSAPGAGHTNKMAFKPDGTPLQYCEKCDANGDNGKLANPCPNAGAAAAGQQTSKPGGLVLES